MRVLSSGGVMIELMPFTYPETSSSAMGCNPATSRAGLAVLGFAVVVLGGALMQQESGSCSRWLAGTTAAWGHTSVPGHVLP